MRTPTLQKEHEKKLESLRGEAETEIALVSTRLHSQADGLISDLNNTKEQAESVVGAITTTTLISRYREVADVEKRKAFWFQMSTILSLILLVIAAGFLLYSTVTDAMTTSATITKTLLTFTLGGLATYCGSQAKRHHEQERNYRDTELRLRTLEPYLATLEEKDRQELRKGLAEDFFRKPAGYASNSDRTFSLHEVPQEAYDLARKVLSKFPSQK